ncbi:type II secretion system protein N [Sphingomonas sp.]|jgi:general secretion pathway protein C|uniref:type II secretion system protein N n=1 Tax=Sphingomonas sp. TaxID=28214 RepID=UPI002E318591|nr:type II secretion system protein N [Sphingomonas sp.]HEX4693974.1 type II secretion system protein N [Sphingomonas sp.]
MRLSLSPRARALLRRFPPVNLYSLGELLLLAVLAVQCARLFWTIVTPVGPVGDWRLAQPGVGGSPVAILRGFDPFFRVSGAASPGASVTSLQLTLYGTRIDDATGLSSAIIAGPDGVQNSVGVGEEVAPGVKLKAVAFDHVTLDRGGTTEELYIDQSGGSTPAVVGPGGEPSSPVNLLGPGVTAAQIRSDVSFTPRIEGGQVTGLIVRPEGSGAGFRAIGLRDGDVVTAAAGHAITGPGDLDRILSGLTPGSNLSITVERGGQPSAITVTIKGQ